LACRGTKCGAPPAQDFEGADFTGDWPSEKGDANQCGLPVENLTRLLQAWSGGDPSALHQLTPIVYAELHRIARRNFKWRREGRLLQPSALVNEAYLRLIGGAPVEWANLAHFFGVSAKLMRQILIDFARTQHTGKRANSAPYVELAAAKDSRQPQPTPST